MNTGECEKRIMMLQYLIQDLDLQISQTDVPSIQITTAQQLANLSDKRERLVRERDSLRMQRVELERQRQISLQVIEKSKDHQHKESKRLSKISIWTDIALAVLGKFIR